MRAKVYFLKFRISKITRTPLLRLLVNLAQLYSRKIQIHVVFGALTSIVLTPSTLSSLPCARTLDTAKNASIYASGDDRCNLDRARLKLQNNSRKQVWLQSAPHILKPNSTRCVMLSSGQFPRLDARTAITCKLLLKPAVTLRWNQFMRKNRAGVASTVSSSGITPAGAGGGGI